MKLCCACCATLDAGASSSAVPAHSEKPDPPPVDFACGHSVCGSCQRKRRSLAQSCILCSTAEDLLSSGTTPKSASRAPSPPRYAEKQEDQDFVLGDDSDDEGEEPGTPPPPPLAADEQEWGETAPPAYEAGVGAATYGAKDEKREQCALHHIRPDDTLLGLSLRYGVEGHVLCTLNKLLISTLTTTPHLLHAKPFILLPPGARPSTSTEPLLPAPLERKRLIVRRFQVAVKCPDWAVAQAYCDQVFQKREDEARFVRENRAARGEAAAEVEVREGGELEEAIEAFQADERWEREQRNLKGKGKGVFAPPSTESAGVRKGARWF